MSVATPVATERAFDRPFFLCLEFAFGPVSQPGDVFVMFQNHDD